MIGMEGARGGMAWDVLRVRVCLRVCALWCASAEAII